jgi:hypothetical protein
MASSYRDEVTVFIVIEANKYGGLDRENENTVNILTFQTVSWAVPFVPKFCIKEYEI